MVTTPIAPDLSCFSVCTCWHLPHQTVHSKRKPSYTDFLQYNWRKSKISSWTTRFMCLEAGNTLMLGNTDTQGPQQCQSSPLYSHRQQINPLCWSEKTGWSINMITSPLANSHRNITLHHCFFWKKEEECLLASHPPTTFPASPPIPTPLLRCEDAAVFTKARKREERRKRNVQLYLLGKENVGFSSDVAAPQPQITTSYDQEPPAPAACHMTRLQCCRDFWDL